MPLKRASRPSWLLPRVNERLHDLAGWCSVRRCNGVSPSTTRRPPRFSSPARRARSEEHTSELQSPCNLVCRLLLEKKKNKRYKHFSEPYQENSGKASVAQLTRRVSERCPR